MMDNKIATMDDLPTEILYEIFSYLDIVKRQRLQTVCKRWKLIIQQMWRSINKLKFHEGDRYPGKYIANTVRLVIRKALHLIDVLKLFNGNLKKLDINHRSYIKQLPQGFFDLLNMNKSLSTLKLNCRDKKITEAYLQCLIPENIQSLSIVGPLIDNSALINLDNILLKARKLEFLQISNDSKPRIEIINKLDSLKSLHIDANDYSIKCYLNLPNLQVLSIQYAEISDQWLIELVKNCKQLRSLELRECNSFTTIGLYAIGTLPNLCYLNLLKGPIVDNEFLCKLSNLEEIYLDLDPKITLDELTNFLERSRSLKRYGFSYLGHDILFASAGRKVGVVFENDKNEYLDDYEWEIRF